MKKISADAYQALREALSSITWFKRAFGTTMRTLLRDSPELIAGLNFNEPKRIVADQLVDRLMEDERAYRDTTLQLMLEIAAMTRFPDIEQIKDAKDRELRMAQAKGAVASLNSMTKHFAAETSEREKITADLTAARLQSQKVRTFGNEVDALRGEFLELQSLADPRARGLRFEPLLTNLFKLFDMEPRLSYSLDSEQIDGSLNFDTDDYIVEARWRSEQVDRGDADIFAAKVKRKGKNALGLIVSVAGFSPPALASYREATPFITMDGNDLYLILDQRIRLDDVLRSKRRHMNDTGSCYLPASKMLGD